MAELAIYPSAETWPTGRDVLISASSDRGAGPGPSRQGQLEMMTAHLRLRGWGRVKARNLKAPIVPVPVPVAQASGVVAARDPQHAAWKATKAQTVGGRPSPRCLADAGLNPDAWHHTDRYPPGTSVRTTLPFGKRWHLRRASGCRGPDTSIREGPVARWRRGRQCGGPSWSP